MPRSKQIVRAQVVALLAVSALIAMSGSSLRGADGCTYLPTSLERAVLDELNLVRKDPAGYAFHLEDLEPSYYGKNRRLSENTNLTTQEGVAAVEEAVHQLQSARPRLPLAWDPCLSLSAVEHVRDTGLRGLVGHDSSRGEHFDRRIRHYLKRYREVGENISYGSTTAEDVLQQLLIDDGVPGRGHRHNILESQFNAAGAACGPHRQFGTMCVIDFARE